MHKASPPGRETPLAIQPNHYISGVDFTGNYPAGIETAQFAMGCFWGAERLFWQQKGVYTTAVGYAGGVTSNPTYEEVCSGRTGHTEAVLILFDPKVITYADMLKLFWENHNPTQGMRQGNDTGTQYRSAIHYQSAEQLRLARLSKEIYQQQLAEMGVGEITTEIESAKTFYFAETYHQQYLAKNPGGYCGLTGAGACLITDSLA